MTVATGISVTVVAVVSEVGVFIIVRTVIATVRVSIAYHLAIK